MANDTVILSPECVGKNRREGIALEAIITGAFISAGVGGFELTTAGEARQYLAIENIATAQDEEYVYSIDENVFATIPTMGCRVKVKALAEVYAEGATIQIGAGGLVSNVVAGTVIGVVPIGAGATVTAGGSLIIDLL